MTGLANPTISKEPPSAPPVPPPLPPSRSNPRQKEPRPSGFLAKLESAPEDWVASIPMVADAEPYRYKPLYYFFYGTLANTDMLKGVLDLSDEPELRQAKIVGYSLTSWGQCKALIDGKPGEEVLGYAYEVQSPEHEYKLAYYETNAYELAPCLIQFTDGNEPSQIVGRTFMYAGDAQALKDGRFDIKLWELQMGTRLPPGWGKSTTKPDA
ncbi:hypothetical protein FGRMN_4284 [Fusarium graminum]|nr:hypothetical protein FGRMN_4284 [Fusarium graminum]